MSVSVRTKAPARNRQRKASERNCPRRRVRPFEETVVDSDRSSDVSFAQQAFPGAFCGYQVFSRPTAHVQRARIVFAANGPTMKILSDIFQMNSGSLNQGNSLPPVRLQPFVFRLARVTARTGGSEIGQSGARPGRLCAVGRRLLGRRWNSPGSARPAGST